jgi:hypothetical protein
LDIERTVARESTVRQLAVLAALSLLLNGCTTVRSTSPARSAQEELAISTAADHAAKRLAEQVPQGLKIFVDATDFAAQDNEYGTATIEDQLLRRGDFLITDKTKADAIVTIRAGVLSTYERATLVGLPQVPIPFYPVGQFLTFPELDLYKDAVVQGMAKFAASVYDQKSGKLIVSTDPAWGFSHQEDWVIFFLFSWSKDDLQVPAPPDHH